QAFMTDRGFCPPNLERNRLIERTKAGLERAKRAGKRLGRPPCSPVLLRAAADHVARGISIRKAAAESKIPASSLRRFLKRCAQNVFSGAVPKPCGFKGLRSGSDPHLNRSFLARLPQSSSGA